MRTRARRKTAQTSQNLDSFLDILTNTVGVLMFISLFVTLIATGSSPKTKVTIQTPLSTSTEKQSLWFEIQNNKISHLDLRQVRERELELSGNLPNCNRPTGGGDLTNYQSCLSSVLGRQNNFSVSTDNYEVRTVNNGVSLEFRPLSQEVGETTTQLATAGSQFKQVLSQFDSQKDYIIFIVRPDSFEAFRAARQQAWAAGYEVGWEPLAENEAIRIRTILGSELPGGRSAPGVQ